ncbi:MAG: adenylate/guanylate cyclase domain-containing protein [Verrucomicrobia bacterium]|nr:adenylate/guanylate cyclase domain-containing protein [Verrucomicrobiota bacterium]
MQQWLQNLWQTRVRRDRMVIACLAIVWSLLLVGLMEWFPLNFVTKWELASIDQRFRWRGPEAPSHEVLIIGIDEDSFVTETFSPEELKQNPTLKLLSSWPWPRKVHALALEQLLAAGAKVVGFDLLFTSPSKYGPDDDDALRTALEKARNRVVVGANWTEVTTGHGDNREKWMLPQPVLPDSVPALELCAAVNYKADVDNVVRRIYPRWLYSEENQLITGLSVRLAQLADPKTQWALTRGQIPINFAGPKRTIPTYPFYNLFQPKAWERNLHNGEIFKNKIVLIGPTQNFMQDSHATPFGREIPGVEIHAAAVSTLLKHNELHESRPFVEWLLIMGFATAGVLSLLAIRHPLLRLVPAMALTIAYVAVCQVVFNNMLMVLPLAAPIAVLVPVTLSGLAWQLLTEQLEKRRARQALERQVSKEVADELMKEYGALQLLLAPHERHLVVFFSDIRNFTTLFEKGDPKTLITQLNEYLTAMSAIVAQHGGTLDKYIGDAIMAFWGAPTSRGAADDALRAVSAALEMRKELAALQPQWKANGYPEIKIGIGIHAGTALVGEVGSAQRSEYTAIGDTVNTASRIEGINKETGTDLLISEAVYSLVKERVRTQPVGVYALKGRAEKVTLYRVDELLPEKGSNPKQA